ncbi:MAG: TonB-dependent receptor domain-containing protein [Gammaproteobacteria bacterium]
MNKFKDPTYDAYIDAEITKSNDFPVGGRLEDVAEHQATFWGRYLFTSGPLRNLSLSVGANYVGDRAGTLSNTFELPDYVTADLAAAYRWKNFKVELIAQNVGDEEYFTAEFVKEPTALGISRSGGARNPHVFQYTLRFLRSGGTRDPFARDGFFTNSQIMMDADPVLQLDLVVEELFVILDGENRLLAQFD